MNFLYNNFFSLSRFRLLSIDEEVLKVNQVSLLAVKMR